jgi:hypothetical protein
MTPLRSALAFACATLAAAPAVFADASAEDAKHLHLYQDVKLGPVSPEARRAVQDVVKSCAYSMMARVGPSPRDRARCDNAAAQAAKVDGAARASLLALELADTPGTARFRLYDVVAKSGDLALAEPLARALARVDQAHAQTMMLDDSFPIGHTLAALTYASIGERAPWQRYERPNLRQRSDEWTAFLAARRGWSRDQLKAERVSDARAHRADADQTRAYFAASFLAGQPDTRAEGKEALERLLARDDLPANAKSSVRSVLGSIEAPPQKIRS